MGGDLAQLIRDSTERLASVGVPSPLADVELLLAAITELSRGELKAKLIADTLRLTPEQHEHFHGLIARRERREPLQHLTGQACFRRVELQVGPGVFVPRPETELLAGWIIEQANTMSSPLIVDLCTGSGAIAKSIAMEVPDARVYAVELDPGALAWAERNLAGTGVELVAGDACTALGELDAQVDLVSVNPPYVPLTAWESVSVEARDFDPHLALFSGEDGLELVRRLEPRLAELLRPGGRFAMEHAEAQGDSLPAIFAGSGRWSEVRDHLDLAGRSRYVTARLAR